MRKMLVVASREYQAAVRTKAFIISLVLMPLLMGGSLLVQLLLKDRVDTTERKFVIVDRTPGGELGDWLAQVINRKELGAFLKAQKQPVFTAQTQAAAADAARQRFELSQQVRNGEIYGFLEIGAEVKRFPEPGAPSLGETAPPPREDPVVIRYQSNSPMYRTFAVVAEKALNERIQQERCAKVHVDPKVIKVVQQPVELVSKGLSKRDPETGEIEDGKE